MPDNPSIAPREGRILVTGANGQLGREIRQLAPQYPQYEFIFFSREELPLLDFALVKNSFREYRPQYCINCAAYTAVDKAESEKEAAFRINAEATGVLAAICKEYDCGFIHISTDYVFDGTAATPYKEDAVTHPQGIYGASKLQGEIEALRFDPGAIIIRTSWVYSEFGKNFVKTMLRLMAEKKEIAVVNDQYGSPTYAADLAETIMQVIKKRSSPATAGIFHYSNEGTISWYDFALAIKELSGSPCQVNPISSAQYPTPAKRPAYSVLDNTKIRQVFGIAAKDWKQSLAACIRAIEKAP